jgi:hypothetical protein
MVIAYGFISDWVDQNIGKGTIIARRSAMMPKIPTKLLSEVAKNYNPQLPTNQFIISSQSVPRPPAWIPNGIFFSGISSDTENSQLQILLSSLIVDKPDLKLFWLTDDSFFVYWDRKKLEEQTEEKSEEMTPSTNKRVEEILQKDEEFEQEEILKETEDKVEEIYHPLLVDVLNERFKELGWTTKEVSVSPLGGLTAEDGHSIGQARKRKVTSLRDPYLNSDWQAISSWKQQCIDL